MLYASVAKLTVYAGMAMLALLFPLPLAGQEAEVVPEPIVEQKEAEAVVVQKEEPINTNYGGGDCSKYEELIRSYDWPADTALEICRKESGGNANAINWNDVHTDSSGNVICVTSRGLMQIACVHVLGTGKTVEDLQDPEINVAIAYRIWKKEGFHPWSTY